ncbi:hypothetical protein [Quadrisphaera sp. DSM 44207]|uniref:hypothetical protein n=1 Tax=Quadrisphaera sp. DSM 44207 TaxID=1881057 RepID=UPI00088BEE7D|nr:hypothetical protein [Quadrisphaera sp. DSM 44207]SDQ32869.1 hypothetical protein SAMN05428996_1251 [Quadrisphaera sp. DSM 44207]
MGLGGGPRWWDEYEWVDLSSLRAEPQPERGGRARSRRERAGAGDAGRDAGQDAGRDAGRDAGQDAGGRGAAEPAPDPLADALRDLLTERPLWVDAPGARVLLVDLDNLRAGPARWRARMAAVVTLARQADTAHLAGQEGAVERARPHLAEFADRAVAVPDGSDLADHVLLDAAAADADAARGPVQVVVVSNDGIFADLASRGPLVVLSPGVDALSDRLDDAATDVLDLAALEQDVAASA